MELITERCMIRNMKMEDANDLYQVLSDASVMYTLLPIQFSIQQFYEQKLAKLDTECEQERIRKRLEAFQQAQQKNACPPA